MASADLKITFLGLGAMGNAIAKNILKKGFRLVVWSRTSSKADELVKAGAHLAPSMREAVASADVILSCLFDDKSCLETAQGENGYLMDIRKGAVHINITTIGPNVASELDKLHTDKGAHYIAGPVLGRPDVAAAGQLRSFVAGNRAAIERVRPVIESYSAGSIIVVSEDPAQANVLKLTANMVLTSNISLFGQVYALNERWGIDGDVTRQLMEIFYSHPGLLAYEDRVGHRNYTRPAGEGFSVDGGLKDINAMLNAGEQVGVPLPFCSVTKEQCISAIAHGLREMDWSVLADTARLHAGYPHPKKD